MGVVRGGSPGQDRSASADLTVLDRDLTAGPSILERHADLTIVGGKVVYERPR